MGCHEGHGWLRWTNLGNVSLYSGSPGPTYPSHKFTSHKSDGCSSLNTPPKSSSLGGCSGLWGGAVGPCDPMSKAVRGCHVAGQCTWHLQSVTPSSLFHLPLGWPHLVGYWWRCAPPRAVAVPCLWVGWLPGAAWGCCHVARCQGHHTQPQRVSHKQASIRKHMCKVRGTHGCTSNGGLHACQRGTTTTPHPTPPPHLFPSIFQTLPCPTPHQPRGT